MPMGQDTPPPALRFIRARPRHQAQAQAQRAHLLLPADIALEAPPLRQRGVQDIPMRQGNPPPARRFIRARRQARALNDERGEAEVQDMRRLAQAQWRTVKALFVGMVAVHGILRSLNVAFAADGMDIFIRGIMNDMIVLAACIIVYTLNFKYSLA